MRTAARPPVTRPRRRLALRLAWALILLPLVWLGWKALRIIQLAQAVRAEVSILQGLASNPTPEGIVSAGATIAAARRDILALRDEARPWLWTAPLLDWLPDYGSDLGHAEPLLDWASGLVVAADETYTGLLPLMRAAWGEGAHPIPAEMVGHLAAAQPRFALARQALAEAEAACARLPADELSPQLQNAVEKIDPLLPRLRSGLDILSEAPALLGADRPKTYLILLQNEDELRPTGGFITAVGTITLDGGQVTHLRIETSLLVDDFSKPYPTPPEPLFQYLNARLWLLRDSNWSPDFPTSAARAETLYNLARPEQPLDGVVALDQAAVRTLMRVIGPVTLADGETVDAGNVIDYMHRVAWANVPSQGFTNEWWLHHKDFIQQLAAAMLAKVGQVSWLDLGQVMLKILDERHMLLWLKGQLASVLASEDWGGAIQPGEADFLMVVDANLGFNKANAAVQMQFHYTVDLLTPSSPTATLTVVYFNPAPGELPCRHDPDPSAFDQYADAIRRCYWNYLRVYTPQETTLLTATPHDVPGEWMLLGQAVPGMVRVEPGENGTHSFGTLLVVPFSATLTTEFQYTLAPGAVTTPSAGDEFTYQLHVQKQPGARDIPLSLSVQLPPQAELVEASPEGAETDGAWTLEVLLTKDTDVKLRFRAP